MFDSFKKMFRHKPVKERTGQAHVSKLKYHHKVTFIHFDD